MADQNPHPLRVSPMLIVGDMRAAVNWYRSAGFTVADTFEDGGELVFARLTFGAGELTLSPGDDAGPRGVRLWFITDAVDALYDAFRQPRAGAPEIRFDEDLYTPFYGGRQFSIRDLNGVPLIFWQPPS